MPVDFFIAKCQIENVSDREFGIFDDDDEGTKTHAYIDTEDRNKWIATVKNATDKPINFTAVDNCVEILKENGEMDFRCDAMLTNEDHIVFVELKNQAAGWITHAVDEQLQASIDHFKANHDITKYKYKRAFACNKRFPNFRASYKDKMAAFYKKNNIRLNLTTEIVIK